MCVITEKIPTIDRIDPVEQAKTHVILFLYVTKKAEMFVLNS